MLPLVPPYLVFITGTSLDELIVGKTVDRPHLAGGARVSCSASSTVFVLLGATASCGGPDSARASALAGPDRRHLHHPDGPAFPGLIPLRLPQPRGALPSRDAARRPDRRLCGGPCLRLRLDALHRSGARHHSGGCRERGECRPRAPSCWPLYSAGLGIPFLLAALGVDRFLGFLRRFSKHLGMVEKVMGGLLVLAGIGFLTGFHQRLAYWLLETFPGFATLG